MKHTISVLVENHAGILSRISGLFSRRGFNIDSLAVGITETPEISRITIVVEANDYLIEQMLKQLNKLIDVIKVRCIPDGDMVDRELVLIKLTALPQPPISCHYRIGEEAEGSVIVELCDTTDAVNAAIGLLTADCIIEIVRTGMVALQKNKILDN